MRVVIQRVWEANVKVDDKIVGEIKQGLCVFIGIEEADALEDIEWLKRKILNMRIFSDSKGLMNASLLDIGGSILLVSQFTLHASTKKGNRPSFIKAAKPNVANDIFDKVIDSFAEDLGNEKVETGIFGADMKVSIGNDGPVTIWLDTKQKE